MIAYTYLGTAYFLRKLPFPFLTVNASTGN